MPNDSTASVEKQPAPLSGGGAPLRLVGIGVVILCVVAGFLYLGGWFSPGAVTPARFVNAFERADGIFLGFRRNHAKGIGVSGYFESNGQGARLSKAVVFRAGRVPVLGRFSFGGGDPEVADAAGSGPGSGAAVLAARWRRVADRDGQPSRISIQDSAGFLRQPRCISARSEDG